MSKIERGQFSSLLRRYLGMAGQTQVADELAPEISAVLALESERPEWEFLKGAKLMAACGTVAASAGLESACRLRNPAASGVIGIIDHISFSTGGLAATIRVTIGNDAGNLTTTVQSNSRDTRYPRAAFPGNSALICSTDYGANGDTVFHSSLATNSSPPFLRTPFVITPGFQMQVTSLTLNVGLLVNFHWLERTLDQLERLT